MAAHEHLLRVAAEKAEQGDVRGMLDLWKAVANDGLWQLCARIGEFYERGSDGVAVNQAEALRWYRKAVFEGDDPAGHVALARAYFNGKGVERDLDQARRHIERGLFYGSPEAAIYMGLMHFSGVTTPASLDDARRMFEAASSKGYPYARMMLANIAMRNFKLWEAAKLTVSALRLASRIAKEDPADARLLGLEPKHFGSRTDFPALKART